MASANEELNSAFVLHAHVLSQVWELLAEKVGPVRGNIHCSDRLVRDFTECDKLLKYQNPPGRSIQRIHLYARNAAGDSSARVVLRDQSPLIRIEADGDEQRIVDLRDSLVDIFAGTKPWYSIINQSGISVSAFTFVAVLFGSMVLMVRSDLPKAEADTTRAILVAGISIGVALTAVGTAFAAFKLVNRWFPKGVFAIGQGKDRYERLEKFQWGVLVAFIVGVAASASLLFVNSQAKPLPQVPANAPAASQPEK